MPLTQERQNITDLRAVGFTEQQAVVLAEKLESAAQAVAQDLKGFIIAELDKRFAQLDAKMEARFAQVDARFAQVDSRFAQMEARIAEVEARFERTLRIQLATVLTAVGVAVAIIKLIP